MSCLCEVHFHTVHGTIQSGTCANGSVELCICWCCNNLWNCAYVGAVTVCKSFTMQRMNKMKVKKSNFNVGYNAKYCKQ